MITRTMDIGQRLYVAILLVLFSSLGVIGENDARSKPPNVLFIFTDDHACQSIGAYGSKINKTPNIDRIAREGAVFVN